MSASASSRSAATEQAVELYHRGIGKGDVTTESIFPYARHIECAIFGSARVSPEEVNFWSEVFERIDPTVSCESMRNGGSYARWSPVIRLRGNGRAILGAWRILSPVAATLTSLKARASAAADTLWPKGIELLVPFQLPIGLEKILSFAIELGGGTSWGNRMDDVIVITPEHVLWCGGVRAAVEKVIEEVGPVRKNVKVVAEVRTVEEALAVPAGTVNGILCRGFAPSMLQETGERREGRTPLLADESVTPLEASRLWEYGIKGYELEVNACLSSPLTYSLRTDTTSGIN